MNEPSYRALTPEEKLELAGEIQALIEARFPASSYFVAPDVLLMALIARTSSSERQGLGVRLN